MSKLGILFWITLVCFFVGINASQTLKDSAEFLMVLLGGAVLIGQVDTPKFERNLLVVLGLWVVGGIVGYYFFAPIEIPIQETELLNFRWIFFFFSFVILAKLFLEWDLLLKIIALVFAVALVVDFTLFWKSGGRAGGLLNNPINFANVIAPFVLICWSYVLHSLQRKRINFWVWAALFCVGGGTLLVLLSQTRGVIVAILPLLVGVSFFYGRKGILTSTVVVAVSLAVALALSGDLEERMANSIAKDSNDYSKITRIAFWKANIEIWKQYPVFGVGYGVNNYIFYRQLNDEIRLLLEKQPELKTTHAHNQYIHFLAGGGLWGLLCFFAFIGICYKYLWIAYRAASKDSIYAYWAIGLAGGLTSFLVSGMTEANFTVTKNRYVFVFLAAMIVALYQRVSRSKKEEV